MFNWKVTSLVPDAAGWRGAFCQDGEEVELLVRDAGGEPSASHLAAARDLAANLDDLRRRMVDALEHEASVRGGLFPHPESGTWELLWIALVDEDPARARAHFGFDGGDYAYIYVVYLVELAGGEVTQVWAETQ